MQDKTLDVQLAELESRLAFQEITIEELSQTLIAHELEICKLRNLACLLMEKVKITQSSCSTTEYEEIPPPHY